MVIGLPHLERAEVESDRLRAALLVAGPHGGELGVVGLAGLVEVLHRLPRQRVQEAGLEVESAVLLLLQQLARPVPEQLVQAHLAVTVCLLELEVIYEQDGCVI